MKEIFKKHSSWIIIIALIVVFLGLAIFVNDDNEPEEETIDALVSAWVSDSMTEEYTIVVLAQTTCSYCQLYEPIFEAVVEDYDLNVHWIEIDLLNTSSYATLSTTYDIEDLFSGTPFTLLTYHGSIVNSISGYVDEEELAAFLIDNGVSEK